MIGLVRRFHKVYGDGVQAGFVLGNCNTQGLDKEEGHLTTLYF